MRLSSCFKTAAAVLASTLALTLATPRLTHAADVTAVYIPMDLASPYWVEVSKGLKSEGQKLGWTVQIYNAAEALPNLLNPFWMLPLMGVLSVRTRELAGFSILQLLVHAPLIFVMTWALSYTLPYVPPVIP